MRNYARAGLALLSLVMTAGSVQAQVTSSEDKAKIRDAVAEIKLRDRAERGDGAAMVELGRRANSAKNEAEAVQWFQKAAATKHPDALYTLGCAYAQGLGELPVDDVKAQSLFEEAGKAGHAGAMLMAGMGFDRPSAVHNPVKAVYWYTQAAKHNDGLALRRLAELTMRGQGGLKADAKAAAKLFARGAQVGDVPCVTALAFMHLKGTGGFVQSDAEALHLFRIASDAGDLQATSVLAHSYLDQRMGLKRDPVMSTTLFRQAAKAGHAHSMMMLGMAYHEGVGTSVNHTAAVKWLEKSISAGDRDATFFLGCLLSEGEGIPKDDARALKLFEASAAQGKPLALVAVGGFYQEGRGGLPRDPAKALELYKKAAGEGVVLAYAGIGVAYANGDGVDRNVVQAETALKQVVKGMPKSPSAYGNYAWFLLGEGRTKEGLTQLDKAFSLTDKETSPGLRAEMWFYSLAFRPQSRDEAIEQLRILINEKKAKSEHWDFSRVTARALKAFPKHQDAKWLPVLADVIAGKAEPSVLAEWPAWNKASPQQAAVTEKGTETGD